MQSETELIAQATSGNTDAYGELIDRYKQAIYRHCFVMLRDEDAAEDITQETFISAYYNLKRYDGTYRMSTWLFKISTNKCLTYLKKKGKQVADSDKLVASLAATEPLPHTRALHDELYLAVERLRPQYRAAISLYYWQGLDYAATAEAMGAPVNSVRVWLKRAKEELRKELA